MDNNWQPIVNTVAFSIRMCGGAIFLLCSIAVGSESKQPPELSPNKLRTVVYTKEFAQRFGLVAPEHGTEPSGGIEAIEFTVESGLEPWVKWNPILKIYLNNRIPMGYPENSVAGALNIVTHTSHFFLGPVAGKWPEAGREERKHQSRLAGSYTSGRIGLASADHTYSPWSKKGLYISMFVAEYHRQLTPDLAYLKLIFIDDKGHLRTMDAAHPVPLDIWALKPDIPIEKTWAFREKDDFLKFPVPEIVIRKAINGIQEIGPHNAYRFQQYMNQETERRKRLSVPRVIDQHKQER